MPFDPKIVPYTPNPAHADVDKWHREAQPPGSTGRSRSLSRLPRLTERGQERLLNRRAETYFELRDMLEAGELAIPRSDDLMRELTAITWTVNGAGRIAIERKADIKVKLGGMSPDLSDTLAMAVGTGGVIDFETFRRRS